ncbi:MAG: HPr family phosphocarrier protein [Rhodopirellula sp.]|nr:HPr family phosphocarrier protein [Rhodopirellula sp.]
MRGYDPSSCPALPCGERAKRGDTDYRACGAREETPVLDGSANRRVVVSRAAGLHARPCVAIATTVRRFQAKVKVCCGRRSVDARDVLQLLTLGAGEGTELLLVAEGPDGEQALEALQTLFANDFDLPPDRPGCP